MQRVRVGIYTHAEPSRLRATLASLCANTEQDFELLLLGDGADRATSAALASLVHLPQSNTDAPVGTAGCFNRLVASADADVYVLLESGARVGPGWLTHLLDALGADERNGLAGPSTNLCRNVQAVGRVRGLSARGVDEAAREVARRFGPVACALEPPDGLADFCYAVRREVVEAVGAAEELHGPGPSWEVDYNLRAARAGWRGVWACASYVHRAPFNARRRREEALRHTSPHPAPAASVEPTLAVVELTTVNPHDDAPGYVRTRAPLVSCIMPTADRREYLPQAIRYFQRQDYPNLELLIVDDGADAVADCVPEDARVRYLRLPEKLCIGAKRNLACEHARGEFVVHWDDDDWYPPWRVSAQVRALEGGGFELCGTSQLFYFEPSMRRAWRYKYSRAGKSWVAGNTLAYRKSFWERRKFPATRVGEDTRFVMSAEAGKVCDLDDPRLCAATVHAANTSRKVTNGAYWRPEPTATLIDLLGEDLDFYLAHARPTPHSLQTPLVSCIMPTGDRRPFVRLALEHFARQDYPRKELVVVDDGADSVGDLCEGKPGVTYVRLQRRTSIGAKRNLACARARGEIIAHWDDDDWYAPSRLRYQAEPILAGEADLTGLSGSFVMVLPGGEFWTTLRPLHARMFTGDVHGGTLVYRKSLFEEGLRYPASNLAEDAALIRRAVARGKRLLRLDNAGEFVYVRHGRNAWREFSPGHFLDPAGWERTVAPQTFPAEALRAYQTASASLVSAKIPVSVERIR